MEDVFTKDDKFNNYDIGCAAGTAALIAGYHAVCFVRRRCTPSLHTLQANVDANIVSWVKNATYDRPQRINVVQCLRTSGMIIQSLASVALIGSAATAKNSLSSTHWSSQIRHIVPCMLYFVSFLNFSICMLAYYYLLYLMPLQEMVPGGKDNPRNALLTKDEKNMVRMRAVSFVKQSSINFRVGWRILNVAVVTSFWPASPVAMLVVGFFYVVSVHFGDVPFNDHDEESMFPTPRIIDSTTPPITPVLSTLVCENLRAPPLLDLHPALEREPTATTHNGIEMLDFAPPPSVLGSTPAPPARMTAANATMVYATGPRTAGGWQPDVDMVSLDSGTPRSNGLNATTRPSQTDDAPDAPTTSSPPTASGTLQLRP
jgi:hypothetical protein